MHCKLTFKHSHITKEDNDFIKLLFDEADKLIEKPHFADPLYEEKMANRKNKLMWWVNERLIKMGKRKEFPVPEREYEKYD
jgi:hypothetical protein